VATFGHIETIVKVFWWVMKMHVSPKLVNENQPRWDFPPKEVLTGGLLIVDHIFADKNIVGIFMH
jgi:hypothetical protein